MSWWQRGFRKARSENTRLDKTIGTPSSTSTSTSNTNTNNFSGPAGSDNIKIDTNESDDNSILDCYALKDVPFVHPDFILTNQPKERCGHCMIRIDDYIYMWSGLQCSLPSVHSNDDKRHISSCIEVFHIQSGNWEHITTIGQPPLGVIDYAAVSIGDMIFYFGGDCNHIGDCCHNSLYGLDVTTLKWREFFPTSEEKGERVCPSMKWGSQMVTVEFNREPYLVVVGGEKTDNTPHHVGGICSQSTKLFQVSDEIHYFRLLTCQWIIPKVTGDIPCLCSDFTLTSVTTNSAVMFGGDTAIGRANDLYLLEFSRSSVKFTKIQRQNETVNWPTGRWGHSSVLIDVNNSGPHLLVVGGYYCNDAWLLDITYQIWTELILPCTITNRYRHSLSVWNVFPNSVWIIEFGGIGGYGRSQLLNDTEIIELSYNGKQWSAGAVSLEQYQHKLKERKVEEEELRSTNNSGDKEEKDQKIFKLTCQLKEKESQVNDEVLKRHNLQQELQEKQHKLLQSKKDLHDFQTHLIRRQQEFEKTLQQYKNSNSQLEKELNQTKSQVQQLHDESQERERKFQEKYANLEKEIRNQESSSWIVSKEEIHISKQVIGKGGWGNVRVGEFRGLKVAVKCLHEVILSDYNVAIFTREMEIASKVRHSNLLQFIGATREGNPIILTELMPTSLRKELESGTSLPYHAVLNISLDVACALNYLHLFKPYPILHRDVSSANVLLQQMREGWRAKVSDYGSANLQNLVSSTSNPGNPMYSSPESFNPRHHSPAMDVYSYGVLLVEMIICRIPEIEQRPVYVSAIKQPRYKSLVEKCLIEENYQSRPTMAVIIEEFKMILDIFNKVM